MALASWDGMWFANWLFIFCSLVGHDHCPMKRILSSSWCPLTSQYYLQQTICWTLYWQSLASTLILHPLKDSQYVSIYMYTPDKVRVIYSGIGNESQANWQFCLGSLLKATTLLRLKLSLTFTPSILDFITHSWDLTSWLPKRRRLTNYWSNGGLSKYSKLHLNDQFLWCIILSRRIVAMFLKLASHCVITIEHHRLKLDCLANCHWKDQVFRLISA